MAAAALPVLNPLPDIQESHEEDDRFSHSTTDMILPVSATRPTSELTSAHGMHSVMEQLEDETEALPDAGASGNVVETATGATTKVSSDVDNDEEYDTDIEVNEEELLQAEKEPVSDEEDHNVGTTSYKRSCSRLNITPENKIMENLANNTLNLKYQGLGEDGAKALAKSLLKNTKVEILQLEDNLITPLGVTFLADMLCDNIYITHIDLSHNDVGTYGSYAIKEMLLWNTTLLHLILSDCKIKDSDVGIMSEGFQINETLVYLDLSHNEICEDGAMLLGNAIAINNSIEQLSLAWNHIRCRGAVQICKGLKRNYCLVKVDLSWNGLGYEGALSLGDALKANKYIRELDVSSNRLTWNCANVIAAGLKYNDNMEVLRIGMNPLTMTGVFELVSAVNNERSEMEYISFEGVPISRRIAYTAEMISKEREFSMDHGGIIDTEDVMGKQIVQKHDALTRLMAFLNDRGIRPMDLFRTLEKDKDNTVSREQFIVGLKKVQAPLETWEIVQIMEILDKDEQGKINYRKLNVGIKEKKIINKKKENKAKAAEKRKQREERKLLNPEVTPSRANSIQGGGNSNLGSMASGVNGSRRASRISLSISQSALDLRRQSMLSLNSMGSNPTSSRPGGGGGLPRVSSGGEASRAALAAAVGSRQQETRQGELQRKLSRLSLPSASQLEQEKLASSAKRKNSTAATASRKTSLVS